MTSILIFLAVLSVLVLVHELGHFLVARALGVKADEFGLGFPPRALGFVRLNGRWKKVGAKEEIAYKNTILSLNWLPLGGFVRLKGEQGEAANEHDSFISKPAWGRLLILAAGVIMNWLLAAAIFSGGFMIGIPAETSDLPPQAIVRDQKVQITETLADAPAERAGLISGDFLLAINGTTVATVEGAKAILQQQVAGTAITLAIERDHKQQNILTESAYIPALQGPGLGVALADTGIVRFPWYQAISQGVSVTYSYTKLILQAFGKLVTDLFLARGVSPDVSGPVGIAVMTGKIASNGWWAVLQFAALLSINLAIVNFLPIPALDGGRALFVVIETIRQKRNNLKFEATLHRLGFLLLLFLVAVVTLHDLSKYGGAILHGLKGMVGL